jgi:hypothetical protein
MEYGCYPFVNANVIPLCCIYHMQVSNDAKPFMADGAYESP